ncbi:MAG: zf-HC2 domain-containing protein [Spirochaetia bacterium]
MCKYERELSAYLDGELSSNESERLEEHLKECEVCNTKIESLKKLAGLTAAVTGTDLHTEERMERSRRRIVSTIERKPRQKVWASRLSLSFPGAAAAALMLFFLGGVVALGTGFILSDSEAGPSPKVSRTDEEPPKGETTVVSDGERTVLRGSEEPTREEMEELFRFLSEKGASVEIKIELPEPSNFNVHGEPQLIRATDFAAIKESSVN